VGEEIETRHQPIKITYGYSRDRRPDLKQFMIDLIVSGDGDVPLFLKVGDGNEADKAVFGQIAREFKKQVDFDSLIVGDSALYSKEATSQKPLRGKMKATQHLWPLSLSPVAVR